MAYARSSGVTYSYSLPLLLPRTYITSIINSLMIYGIFILFYSLSCPTARIINISLLCLLHFYFIFCFRSSMKYLIKSFSPLLTYEHWTPSLFFILMNILIFSLPLLRRWWIKIYLYVLLLFNWKEIILHSFYDDWRGNDWNLSLMIV